MEDIEDDLQQYQNEDYAYSSKEINKYEDNMDFDESQPSFRELQNLFKNLKNNNSSK